MENPKEIAAEILREINALPVQIVPNLRAVRRKYSKALAQAPADIILDIAREFVAYRTHWWIAFELIRYHNAAIEAIGEAELAEFGVEINSWGAVDSFAGFLAGPAWRVGNVSDELVHSWARSEDRWWRRTALVCTVVLNRRSFGGTGDVDRTLTICRMLADDKDDMVVKAMSWALRELIPHDEKAVRAFLAEYDDILAGRVKREVNNKLTTGLKNPKRR